MQPYRDSDGRPFVHTYFYPAEQYEKGLIDRTSYEQWIRKHFYQFRRPELWLEHMRRYGFSYGTRLHGDARRTVDRTHDQYGDPVLGYDEHRWERERALSSSLRWC